MTFKHGKVPKNKKKLKYYPFKIYLIKGIYESWIGFFCIVQFFTPKVQSGFFQVKIILQIFMPDPVSMATNKIAAK